MERLTEDLTMDILSRLPIKYILRCSCVCKSWNSTLTSPSFAATHFRLSSALTSTPNYIINYHKFPGENLLFFLQDDGEDQEPKEDAKEDHVEDNGEENEADNSKEKEEKFTFSHVKPVDFSCLTNCLVERTSAIFMGACNGFLCLSATECQCPTNPMYLFNPVTGEHALLPEFKETRFYNSIHGFGFDATSQEYKVVVAYFHGDHNVMQLHTVGKDSSWRMSGFGGFPGVLSYVLETSLSLFYDGSLYWIILNSMDDKPKNPIGERGSNEPIRAFMLSFQVHAEQLRLVLLPQPLWVVKPYFPNSMDYALQLCGGCLSVAYSPSESVVDIWVMKNYDDWVKQYSIQLSGLDSLASSKVLLPLGFRKNGELMLLFNQQLISYNIENGKYKILKLDGELLRPTQVVPFSFVGSLMSLRSAFGDEFADNQVIRTSEFGNPTQRQQFAVGFEDGEMRVSRIVRRPVGK